MKTTPEHRSRSSAYYWANREKCLAYHRNYHLRRSKESKAKRRAHQRKVYDRQKDRDRHKRYLENSSEIQRAKRRERFRLAQKRRRKSDSYRIEDSLRRRLNKALHGKAKYESALKVLGCSVEDFKIYLESKFDVGMSWENYGQWHIDHIMPCAIFDLSKPEHQKRCFHFSNMQPMWAEDNLRKRDKISIATNINV